MILGLESLWPWAARSAVSHSVGPYLQILGLFGFIFLTLAYLLARVLPSTYDLLLRVMVFVGALQLLIALHTKQQVYYPQLLMICYMLIAALPQKLTLKIVKKLRIKNFFSK